MRLISVSSILGAWKSEVDSGLLQQCKEHWETPAEELSDLMVATFLNQGIAINLMSIEAEYRLENGLRDDSEYFDGQLEQAFLNFKKKSD